MKRIINASTGYDTEYNVTVSFCGFIGCDVDLYIDASADADSDELLDIVLDEYADDMLSGEVIDSDEDEGFYEVEVTFDGQPSATEAYSVYADNKQDAIYDAIEEAKDDIEVIGFYEL
jgi:hypothetical protein